MHISKTNVNEVLKEGGRSGSGGLRARRWTTALIVLELALTLVLLAGAGFMMRSFVNMYQQDVGFDTSRLLTMVDFILPNRKYAGREVRVDFVRRAQERLNANGAIVAASGATMPPVFGGIPRQIEIDGKPAPAGEMPQTVGMVSVGPRYFDALGVAILRGRALDPNDGTPGREVAVINQRLASMYFGNAGSNRAAHSSSSDDSPATFKYAWATIVGLAPNIRQRGWTGGSSAPGSGCLHPARCRIRRGIGGGTLLVRGAIGSGRADGAGPEGNVRARPGPGH